MEYDSSLRETYGSLMKVLNFVRRKCNIIWMRSHECRSYKLLFTQNGINFMATKKNNGKQINENSSLSIYHQRVFFVACNTKKNVTVNEQQL